MEILIAILISAAAVAAVLYPIVGATRARPAVGQRAPVDGRDPESAEVRLPGESAVHGASLSDAELDAEVARYRNALRARTACGRCGLANPSGSRFCAECGRRLDARGREG